MKYLELSAAAIPAMKDAGWSPHPDSPRQTWSWQPEEEKKHVLGNNVWHMQVKTKTYIYILEITGGFTGQHTFRQIFLETARISVRKLMWKTIFCVKKSTCLCIVFSNTFLLSTVLFHRLSKSWIKKIAILFTMCEQVLQRFCKGSSRLLTSANATEFWTIFTNTFAHLCFVVPLLFCPAQRSVKNPPPWFRQWLLLMCWVGPFHFSSFLLW